MAVEIANYAPHRADGENSFHDDELLTTEQLANEWNVPASRLRKGRVSGDDLPPFLKLGHLVRYRRGDVRIWLGQKNRFHSTSEMGNA